MQLYALNAEKEIVSTPYAQKHCNYFCVECGKIVRLRKGNFRQAHFYHFEPNNSCGLHGKSAAHLQVQLYLHALFPANESFLEHRFAEVNRIADVFWAPQKIVFEIQCSPITAQEVLARNQDYRSLGLEVVWILHDNRYNHWRHSSAEAVLQENPYYFTDMNEEGEGVIYDQFEYIHQGSRYHKSRPLPVNLSRPCRLPLDILSSLPRPIAMRGKKWPLAFQGDLLHKALESPAAEALQMALDAEKKWDSHFKPVSQGKSYVFPIYKKLFNLILSRFCRS